MNELMYLLIICLAGFAVFMVGLAGHLYSRAQLENDELMLRRRLGLLGADDRELAEEDFNLLRDEAEDTAYALLGEYGRVIKQTIAAAGSDMTVTELVMRMTMMALLIGGPATYMFSAPGFIVGIIAGYAPYFFLERQGEKRTEELLKQMPDALELMARSIQAGVGLADAFRLVAEEMPLPIAQEWGRVYEEVRFGKEWRIALGNLIARNPMVFDLRLLVSSVLLQRDTGGNIIEILNKISRTIRERYLFDAKVLAMTSEARTSALVMAMMPLGVTVLIIFSNPNYLDPLFEDPVGQAILAYCFASYALGLYAMRVASRVEV